jgi:hypothetical protein
MSAFNFIAIRRDNVAVVSCSALFEQLLSLCKIMSEMFTFNVLTKVETYIVKPIFSETIIAVKN